MNRLVPFAGVVVAIVAGAVAPAAAREFALSQVAADLGFTYAYLGPEDAASLVRPGITILVRPGERLFDINDRTEAMEGPVPRFSHTDVFVSDAFVARLRAIVARFANPAGNSHAVVVNAPYASPQAANVSGVIADFSVTQIPGAERLDVRGKAPAAYLPILITLVGTFSSEMPDVVLSRRQVISDSEGRFTAIVSIAPGYFRGAYLTITASSVPGVGIASSRIETKPPNGHLSVPAEQDQPSIR